MDKEMPSYTENEILRVECDSWEEFIQKVRNRKGLVAHESNDGFAAVAQTGPTLYRGHSDPSWKLSSPLERNYRDWGGVSTKKIEWSRHCEQLIEGFKKETRGMPEVSTCETDNDYWAVGRHYGLLTPLLDWTESPFVAAFFALQDVFRSYQHGVKVPHLKSTKDGRGESEIVHVWGLRRYPRLQRVEGFGVTEPPSISSTRHRNQRGKFTRLNDTGFLDLESFFAHHGIAHFLEVYELPLADAHTALRDLFLMNIRPSTLFPDVAGAATEVNTDWRRSGAKYVRDSWRPEVSE